jgi:hypothetical protein
MKRNSDERVEFLARLKPLWYETRLSLAAIATRLGVAPNTVRRLARAAGWPNRGTIALDGARGVAGSWAGRPCLGLAECPERQAQVARAFALATRQLDAIERRLAVAMPEAPATDAERAAKALAVVVGTLRELQAMDQDAARQRPAAAVAEPIDDDALDQLRTRLSRAILGSPEAGQPAGTAGADAA